jgi:hypothetical protein
MSLCAADERPTQFLNMSVEDMAAVTSGIKDQVCVCPIVSWCGCLLCALTGWWALRKGGGMFAGYCCVRVWAGKVYLIVPFSLDVRSFC